MLRTRIKALSTISFVTVTDNKAGVEILSRAVSTVTGDMEANER